MERSEIRVLLPPLVPHFASLHAGYGLYAREQLRQPPHPRAVRVAQRVAHREWFLPAISSWRVATPALPHASTMTRAWRRNSADSRAPTTESSLPPVGAGQN